MKRIMALATRSGALVGSVLSALLFFGPGVTVARVYQWTDDRGQVHFGDKPADQGAKQLEFESATGQVDSTASAVDGASRRAAQKKLLGLMDQERQQKKQAKAARKAEKIEQQRRCRILRQELADMLGGGYLYFDYNEAGEREFIDDATHQQKVDDMRETIKQKCD